MALLKIRNIRGHIAPRQHCDFGPPLRSSRRAFTKPSIATIIIEILRVNVETLSDGDPDNNFLERAVTFNPHGVLDGARGITMAGVHAYISCARGLVVQSALPEPDEVST